MFDLEQFPLKGTNVTLQVMKTSDAEELYPVGTEPTIWTFLKQPPFSTLNDAKAFVDAALDGWKNQVRLPFVVVQNSTNQVVGTTSFWDWSKINRRVEIGSTWLAKSAQKTGVNTECKLLLLTHAFETMDFQRVEFQTDGRNQASQNALQRIGATQEGILRKHTLVKYGVLRDDVIFSILADEWPEVKSSLIERLKQ